MDASVHSRALKPIEYDAVRRRLWLFGQRCHHGATGAVLAGVALTGLLAARFRPRGLGALAATGGLLMVHDWKDRSLWFEPRRQAVPAHKRLSEDLATLWGGQSFSGRVTAAPKPADTHPR